MHDLETGIEVRIEQFSMLHRVANNGNTTRAERSNQTNNRLWSIIDRQTDTMTQLYNDMSNLEVLADQVSHWGQLSNEQFRYIQAIRSRMDHAKDSLAEDRRVALSSHDVWHFGIYYNTMDIDQRYVQPMENMMDTIDQHIVQEVETTTSRPWLQISTE